MLSRRATIACLLLGLLLALPALAAPLALDDLFHLAVLEGKTPAPLRWWELFTFGPGDPARHELFVAGGILPWWSAADLKLAFWRPLSSALTVLDHALFGRRALGWHLHSLLWWLASLACVARLFRRRLPAGTALLALVLFTIDDAHWMPIVWPAARNGLVSLVFGLVGLGAHLRWREEGWRAGALLGPLAFAVGLAGGEVALAMLAYVVAYEAVGRPQGRALLRGLWPYAVLLVIYGVLRARAGAGAAGSSSYVDPIHEPLRFALEAAGRVPALVANAVFGVPAELWGLQARVRAVLVAIGLLAALLVGPWLRRALAALPPEEARPVRWLALGAALALLPGAGALIGERILLPASVGAAVVFAVLIRDGLRRWRQARGPRRLVAALALAALAVPNLVLAGPLLVTKEYFWKRTSDATHRGVCRTPLGGAGALVVWSDHWTLVLFGGLARQYYCADGTASWTMLSVSPHRQVLTRTSARGLTLAADQPLLDTEGEVGFRAEGRPMRVGDTVTQRGGLTITVEEVRDGRPTRVRLLLPRPLEQGDYRLLVWRNGGLEPLPLAPGESVSLGRP
jgi:hypothetical protein